MGHILFSLKLITPSSVDVRVKDGKIVGFDVDEKSISRVR
jgi:hypothetical protein